MSDPGQPPPARTPVAPTRGHVTLAAVLVVILVALTGLLAAPPASASSLAGARNSVGVIAHAGGQRVAAHEPILAGQSRQTTHSYDQLAVGSCVAPETEAAAGIPQNVQDVLGRVDSEGSPLSGYKGGSTFANDGRGGGEVLPQTTSGGDPITYQEWDVNPYQKGVNRGAERLVTGSDGSAYYTNNHYSSFIQVRGAGG